MFLCLFFTCSQVLLTLEGLHLGEWETIIVIHTIHLCSTLISWDSWMWSVSDVDYLSHWWVTCAFTQSAMCCHAFYLLLAAATVLDFSIMLLFTSSYFNIISLCTSHEKYSALSLAVRSVAVGGSALLCSLGSWLWLVCCLGTLPLYVRVHGSW